MIVKRIKKIEQPIGNDTLLYLFDTTLSRFDTILSRFDTILSRFDTTLSRFDTTLSRFDTTLSRFDGQNVFRNTEGVHFFAAFDSKNISNAKQ